MFSVLYSFNGRVARLPFLGYSMLLWFVSGVLVLGGLALFGTSANGAPGGAVFGGLMIVLAVLQAVWSGIALTIKRLHDMGMSGLHLIWIWGVNVLAGALSPVSPAVSIVLSVVCFMISLWLLFSPGTGANRFDHPSRVSQDRIEPAMA